MSKVTPITTRKALTAAIVEHLRTDPGSSMRGLLQALVPQGFNGHSIRSTVGKLAGLGTLRASRGSQRVTYALAKATPAMTEQVLRLLRDNGDPMAPCQVVAQFAGRVPAESVRDAMALLFETARIHRVGKRGKFRYYAGELREPITASHDLPKSEPAQLEKAQHPSWPVPAHERGATPNLTWSIAA